MIHSQQQEIRRLLIDWVKQRGEIDPATFHTKDWRLVANGVPVVIAAGTRLNRNR